MAAKVAKRDRKQEELDNLKDDRRFKFRRVLGEDWPSDDIEALANGTTHVLELENLIKKGCEPRTAVRILI
jgi:hypothetical protein